MRLDEILAKWRGLMRIRENATTVSTIAVMNAEDDLFDFYAEHGTRLLAVAEAAVEWAEADAAVHTAAKGLCTMPFYRAAGLRQQAERELRRIAFDAAASGEGRG